MANAQIDEHEALIREWLSSEQLLEEVSDNFYSSMELDSLYSSLNDLDIKDVASRAFRLFERGINEYQQISKDYVLDLIFFTEWAESLEKHTFDDVISRKLVLRQPPALYVTKRGVKVDVDTEEYYSSHFPQNYILPRYGHIYAYYETEKGLGSENDFYSQAFVFSHRA